VLYHRLICARDRRFAADRDANLICALLCPAPVVRTAPVSGPPRIAVMPVVCSRMLRPRLTRFDGLESRPRPAKALRVFWWQTRHSLAYNPRSWPSERSRASNASARWIALSRTSLSKDFSRTSVAPCFSDRRRPVRCISHQQNDRNFVAWSSKFPLEIRTTIPGS
jgi:hypothetical protein